MATAQNNLSNFDKTEIPDARKMIIGIVVSQWNNNVTDNLLKGAKDTLLDLNLVETNIIINNVPGTFELPLAAQYLLENTNVQGVIALGSVIQGETKHFDFVCDGATNGLMNVSLKYNKPVIMGILTDNTLQQAIDRSGGKHGNKGVECAVACVKMIALKKEIGSPKGKIGFNT
ncbi:MAG: 6,7-dimethyl-8-ribityllumazine synthase [Flavobacteriales bacterium]|jgi:6,7-dimethyl-8-ribityllumazine synthase|nr:6,7-dimethyl-8-ribityllumazine synthase [Flavobacteriales bacterium]